MAEERFLTGERTRGDLYFSERPLREGGGEELEWAIPRQRL